MLTLLGGKMFELCTAGLEFRVEMCAEHTIGGGGEKKKRSRRRRRRRRRRDFLSAAAEAAKIVGGGGVGGVGGAEPFYQHQYISKFVWP